jgi:hypothetical protein
MILWDIENDSQTTSPSLHTISAQQEELPLSNEQHRHILLHVHGGLVGKEHARQTGERFQCYLQGSDFELVLLIWRTGIWETIRDELGRVSVADIFGQLVDMAERGVGRWLSATGQGKSGITPATSAEVEKLLQESEFRTDTWLDALLVSAPLSIEKLEELSETIEREVGARFTLEATGVYEEKLDPKEYELALTLQQQPGKSGAIASSVLAIASGRVVLRSLKRFIQSTHHGWRATICEEVLRELGGKTLGKHLWGNMKHRAEELFAGVDTDNLSAGTRLLAELERFQCENPNAIIDVCCHSAGAIVVCQMLKAIAINQRRVNLRHLIFLAPACTTSLFEDTVLAHRDLFRHAYLFTMTDEYEQRDSVIPVIYPRSLLYFVSGLLEDAPATPLLGLVRFLDKKRHKGNETLRRIAKFFEGADQGTIILSPINRELGRCSEAVQHGAFDDDEATLKSLFHIISH